MRSNPVTVLNAANSAGAQNGTAIDANQTVSASFQAYNKDATATGTAKVQASNDAPATGFRGNFVPTNWVDIPNATVSMVANTPGLILIPVMSFNFIRVVYTPTVAGTSTIVIQMLSLSV